MSDFTPPVSDFRFLIHDVIGLGTVANLPAFSEISSDLVDAILEEAGKFASSVLAPINRIGDQEGARLLENGTVQTATGWKEAYAQFCEGGWQGISAPEAEGGMGLPILLGAAVAEMWQASNMAFALCPMLTAGAIEALTAHGSDDQRALYLSRMISGEWTGTMNLTEPQAGSDLSKVRSQAIPQDDGSYAITGQKIFITYGDHEMTENIVHLVLARTPDAPAGVKGISLFIVPKYLVSDNGEIGARNDVTCVSLEHKLGIHASPTAVLSFGDQGGATGYLVGEEGKGLAYMFTMMNNARLAVGQQGVAISERAFQQALDYAHTRKQGRDPQTGDEAPIIVHGDVQRMLMRMRSSTDAARVLSIYAACQLDLAHHLSDETARANAQARADLLIPLVKGWSTDLGVDNASLGVQVHGGMGFIEETGAAQHLRDARIAPIYEGTNGIQALDFIGRKVLRDNATTLKALLADIRETMRNSANTPVGLDHAVSQLEETTGIVINRCSKDDRMMQTLATPYLRQGALCISGWLMLRALDALDTSDASASFKEAKRRSCHFFFGQLLPEASFMATQIINSDMIELHDTQPLF
ncbi:MULTISPECIES: acyl-CoA dehydrogenase [Thalassospira]|uniref:3-methylmercaptopropionyl-CoA dehydrogenase n=2 Tax=Thalassospira TaxID=168934 RepID=A0A367W1M0_9PROT|nr:MULTISPECIES: acyl-CoA dehydrogenase [Thalassospira]MDG4721243.1 acyl-CoA dehydrogenase [Thalassospira sp. FZY0004]RCK33655.1 acyl-CoA dehydrogenase [Thalassospira profundimaris]